MCPEKETVQHLFSIRRNYVNTRFDLLCYKINSGHCIFHHFIITSNLLFSNLKLMHKPVRVLVYVHAPATGHDQALVPR